MKLKNTNNSNIKTIIHKNNIGLSRNYKVSFLEFNEATEHTFSYPEKSVKEFIFEKGFAISGNDDHGMFGIVDDGKFYHQEFSKQAKVFANTSKFWARKSFGEEFELTIDDIPTRSFTGDVNLFFNIRQYWHWFCEDIPLIEQFRTNNFPIITNKLYDWQKQSLEFFPDILPRIVEVDTPCIIKADRYHTFSFPAVSSRGKTNADVSEFLKNNLKPDPSILPTKRIYISRGDAVARCVENEHEVKEFLKTRDFICYDNFSKLTIQEKLNVFANAKILVAPTGSNLTHCHAMHPGSIVLDFNHRFELLAECGWNSIGTGVGVNWYTFPAETGSIGPRSKNGKKPKNNNLVIDISILSKSISRVLD